MNASNSTEGMHIGDGVYVSFDGYQIWLRTPRSTGWHEIALEPSVLAAFDEWRKYLSESTRRAAAQEEAK